MSYSAECLKSVRTIVFDMDGVITSEDAYWDAAGLTIRELIESSAFLGLSPADYSPVADIFYTRMAKGTRYEWRKYLSNELIQFIKRKGINSNWDVAYMAFGLYLSPLISMTIPMLQTCFSMPAGKAQAKNFFDKNNDNNPLLHKEGESAVPSQQISEADVFDALEPVLDYLKENRFGPHFLRARDFHLWGDYFRRMKLSVLPLQNVDNFEDHLSESIRGLELLNELNKIAQREIPQALALFGRKTTLWDDCRDIFQTWYLGEELYQKNYNKTLYYGPKPGLIHHEEPMHGQPATHKLLSELRNNGFKLAIATGRPRMEIMMPLERWGLLDYFETSNIITNDDVEEAELELSKQGYSFDLGKPSPFPFLKSVFPEKDNLELAQMDCGQLSNREEFLIVGDALADIMAAKSINCPCAGVMSGIAGRDGENAFADAPPDIILNDVLELPDCLAAVK